VILAFLGAVAAEIVSVIGAAELEFAAFAGGQAVEPVIAMALVELRIAVVEDVGQPPGRIIAQRAASRLLGVRIKPQTDDDGFP